MGDGKKLKEILDSKNTNVCQIAKATGISATTLYSIIQKDSNIRFDFALRLANSDENGAKFHQSSFLCHRFGTALHIFTVAKFQKGLPDFSESPIKSSFSLITQQL